MAVNYILNQDRDNIVPFTELSVLYVAPLLIDDICYGLNLMLDGAFLGTFNDLTEVIFQINAIYNCKNEVCVVDGHSEGGFDEWLA